MGLGGFGPDPAAVAADDALDGGEADAGSGELGGGVEALEGGEQLVGEGHVEAGAVVADVVDGGAAGLLAAELDARGGLVAGELPGVAEEVVEEEAEEVGVALDDEVAGGEEVDGAAGVAGTELLDDLVGELGEVEVEEDDLGAVGEVGELAAGFGAADAGEGEEGVDDVAHADGGGDDAVEAVAGVGVEGVVVVLEEGGAVAAHGAQRGAQVVGDGVAEGFELGVGGLGGGLGGAQGLLGLALALGDGEGILGALALGDLAGELLVLAGELGGALVDAALELVVSALELAMGAGELARGGDGQGVGHELDQEDGGGQRRGGGDGLDGAGQPVGRGPQGPDLHDVGGAAGDDEHAEAQEHPVERHVAPLANDVDQRERDRGVREGDEGVGEDVQPDERRQPEVAVSMRHEPVAGHQVLEELGHRVPLRLASRPMDRPPAS